MVDGRGYDQTKLRSAGPTDPVVEHALLIGEEHGPMRELARLLPAIGVQRITRVLDPSAIESPLTCAVTMFVDSAMPGRVLRVAQLALAQPEQPRVIAVGAPAGPRDMFEYGRGGVGAFLEAPVDRDALRACLVPAAGDSLQGMARALVGRIGMKEAQRELRVLMVSHALRLCDGSRRSAARLLDVTRPAIQRVLREAGDLDAGAGRGVLDEHPR